MLIMVDFYYWSQYSINLCSMNQEFPNENVISLSSAFYFLR